MIVLSNKQIKALKENIIPRDLPLYLIIAINHMIKKKGYCLISISISAHLDIVDEDELHEDELDYMRTLTTLIRVQ